MFVHGLSGSWPNWLEQLPVLARDHRVVGARPPGLRPLADARRAVSISGYARLLDALLGELGIDAPRSSATRWAASSRAELAIAFPQRVERLVLVSAAGLSTYAATAVSPTLARCPRCWRPSSCWRLGASWMASQLGRRRAPRRLRELAADVVVRHPGRLPPPLAAEQLRGAGKPGFLSALEAILDYDFRERLPDRLPDADRLGRRRTG